MREPGPGQRPLCSALNTAEGGDRRDAATGGALATRGPERLKLAKWKDRQDEWRTRVKQEEPGDLHHFAVLDRAKRVALTCARDILFVTDGGPQSLE